MKAVILAGGFGTRISEESGIRPKPMVEIGGKPILWHIMKIYSHHGINDFIICCGYKGYVIKEYFSNYFLHTADVTFDMKTNSMAVHHKKSEPWTVTLVDTGENTMTGGRLKRVAEYIGNETFCLTYGDGVSNVNITDLIQFHKRHGKFATLTSVRQPGRFGVFTLQKDENQIQYFKEKPKGDSDGTAWINGGYFVLEPEILDYIDDDSTVFEKEPLEQLASSGHLFAFKHHDFWQPMDTLRDKNVLEGLWSSRQAPWHIW
ncbi:glucose-1-phosphate cytidylyltransferase [Neotamlana laminarinivorans]|uniref:Glucose-1-phosphate cytidylyltransferase n=1 Tax=Neotamlana laminarinivorans TaxID=2883124 RepID=A0A9X1HZG4_9FLAO|nr:glucose-1-phosphate cytidylyltransferase [Tamlana laminarinivorans]MCB4798994.1 glucose-1-phosphate cytidylyltransferase [Tamlana laminarinivorans]